MTTGFLEYEIIDGLTLKGVAGFINDRDYGTSMVVGSELYSFVDPRTSNAIYETPDANAATQNYNHLSPLSNSISKNFYQYSDINLQGYLTYEKTINEAHYLKAMVGYNSRSIYSETNASGRRMLLSPRLDQINAADATADANSGAATDYRLESVFSRLNYSFKERYLLEANVRYDGSSRFVKRLRFDYFPSLSLGWRISKEPFFKVPFINDLKLRASIGTLGSESTDNYLYQNTYRLNDGYYFLGASGLTQRIGLGQYRIASDNLTWEKTTQQNYGLDLSLWQDRINLTVDYYIKNTTGILLRLPLPGIFGAAAPVTNSASIRNRGYEISLGFKDKIGDWSYYVKGNVSGVQNQITYLYPGTETPGRRIGDPVQNIFGYRAIGLFKTQEEITDRLPENGFGDAPPQLGDVRYADVNGDGKIDADDRENLGTTFPKVFYGFSFGVSWKGIDLSAVFQGIGGVNTIFNGRLAQPFWLSNAPLEFQKDTWRPDNPNAEFPRLSNRSNTRNTQPSSFWIKNADYLKLRNLQIGYTLKKEWLEKIRISSARIYFSGENLLTFSSFLNRYGLDPENVTGGGDPFFFLGGGADTTGYPTVRSYNIGLNFSF